MVEPVPGAPAATAIIDGRQTLIIADYHAGIEAAMRRDGVELEDGAPRRRNRLVGLLADTDADHLVVVGDLVHSIGDLARAERRELAALFDALSVPMTLVKGNHDGDIEAVRADLDVIEEDALTVTDSFGIRLGDIGFVHGHSWPRADVVTAETLCMGHEHPVVRLTDEVGGTRFEQVWVRGALVSDPFRERGLDVPIDGNLVVFPAFNQLTQGTWVNAPAQEFLTPFLPAGVDNPEAYLLDGTRLGPIRDI